jgi:hypothetical protein
MPTVNNRGRLFWGSAWRLEPRRGNAHGEQPWASFLEVGLRLEPRRDNSKRDAGIAGVALRLFGVLFGEDVGCRSVCHFRASCATARAPNGGVRSGDTRFLPINVHHSFSGSRSRMDRAEVSRHGL